MASFSEVLLSQRPDVAGHPVDDWWTLWGAKELRDQLQRLGRQDVLANVGGNDEILKMWYQDYGSKEYPNIWQAQAVPQKSNAEQMAEAIVGKMKTPGDFSKVMAWKDYFDPDLARSAAAQRSTGYFQPILEENIDALRTDMANRGLFRSGIRNKGEGNIMKDIADQEAQMIETLYGIRENEARESYGAEQEKFEQDPTGYKRPEINKAQVSVGNTLGGSPYTDYYAWRQNKFGSGSPTGYRYGLGSVEGAPYKYGQSYTDWWKKKYGADKPYAGLTTSKDSTRSLF